MCAGFDATLSPTDAAHPEGHGGSSSSLVPTSSGWGTRKTSHRGITWASEDPDPDPDPQEAGQPAPAAAPTLWQRAKKRVSRVSYSVDVPEADQPRDNAPSAIWQRAKRGVSAASGTTSAAAGPRASARSGMLSIQALVSQAQNSKVLSAQQPLLVAFAQVLYTNQLPCFPEKECPSGTWLPYPSHCTCELGCAVDRMGWLCVNQGLAYRLTYLYAEKQTQKI